MTRKIELLTDRIAVESAIKEYDQLGRTPFLNKYGFKGSVLDQISFNNRLYDSQAIAGVAFKYQHGTTLLRKEFPKDKEDFLSVLRSLGFEILETRHPALDLKVGQVYIRSQLMQKYGGQRQSGISTPANFKAIFIFSGESGKEFGYQDGWISEDIYQYTGEGQIGDMKYTGGNLAIGEHRKNGKDLLLFEILEKRKGVRYLGLFECASWRESTGLDKEKINLRKTIVFDLVSVKTDAEETEEFEPDSVGQKSLEELRIAALEAANASTKRTSSGTSKTTWYARTTAVKQYVLERANGICEACLKPAPFLKKNGKPYLEPHHTTRLADQGLDHPSSVGAICPNCHRNIHSGKDGASLNATLLINITRKEASNPSR